MLQELRRSASAGNATTVTNLMMECTQSEVDQEEARVTTNSNANNTTTSTTTTSSSATRRNYVGITAPGRSLPSSALVADVFNSASFMNEEDEEALESPTGLASRFHFALSNPLHTKQYYDLNIGWKKTIKITFDRLALLALLDRNLSITENVINILLIITVGVLGCWILQLGLYKEIKVLIFCVVTASCQYSLFKSVQPDAASPIHGYNHIILYSRPIYFICCCTAVLLLHWATLPSQQPLPSFVLYGVDLTSWALFNTLKEVFLYFILLFPLLFSLGLLPQVNTFMMYALEQIDIHVFGGNATTSLASAVYCVVRSCLSVACLTGFAYGGLNDSNLTSGEEAPSIEKVTESGQYILYSIFCSLLLIFSYHLSRSCADFTTLWQLVIQHLFPEELGTIPSTDAPKRTNVSATATGNPPEDAPLAPDDVDSSSPPATAPPTGDDGSISMELPPLDDGATKLPDDDEGDPLPEKLRTTVLSRLTHDMIICSLLASIVLILHSTTALQRVLIHVHPLALWLPPVVFGFILHYIIPQLRKQQPWLCVARPMCMQYEYANYEVYDAAKVMWFERLYVWLCLIEKNIVYPALFICALTVDAAGIVRKHELIGPLLIVVCGLKCLRSTYSYPPSQYLILAFTKLFFNYDFRGYSETFLVDYFFMSIVYRKVYEFLLKLKFIVTYIAPWQITWGSAFHAFAQPFSVPHSAMLFVQAAVSAILSTPLNPVLGSAIFITSYVRPVKFWERDYNTKRMDQSNTRLSTSLLDHNPGADDNNLNSIFYEHLTRSLQHSLCGDLLMGETHIPNSEIQILNEFRV